MFLSDYSLDNFVAHKLSELTECGAPEIPTYANYLSSFILNQLTGAKGSPSPKRHLFIFNFLRRTEGALVSYRVARSAFLEYLQTPRDVLSPYFSALQNFEICIAQCYQGFELVKADSGNPFFVRDDGSEGDRINKLYNASKHADERLSQGHLPAKATSTVWITNSGLECGQSAFAFQEVTQTLIAMSKLAERVA